MNESVKTSQHMGRGQISIDNVVKIYDPEGAAVMAVDHCSLEIAAGEICMIVGPSGCGKTTLLNAIAGFHSINSGSITLDGKLLCGPGKPQATPGSDRIVVFQNGALFPWKNVLDNMMFGPVMAGKMGIKEIKEKAFSMMADAGLSGTENNFPGELSSGVRRRVEIVRALMNDPSVLLLDEPYRALDSLTKSVMHEALLDIYYKNKVTIFFITHDLQEALFLGNKVAIMTSRPCKPKKVLTVDIPYPRSYSVVTDQRFRDLMEETSDLVHEEAKKSFAAGEREG
ncbi:ABC transporter ATP-binding protein [Polynucleobacter sp. IMCC30063]|uniref:ABC transporter ATP-binding protein n=1 Tax=unclassified Polynucleobacter TaxID=2640945 RepID=UPI001F408693|nr:MULTISPECIES: ABC transporter ATP-binding protein [unclassified Polynucleobacter]MCE7505584.1 ABC transporter ATP-binding protein [Polynucleobacter sp. IMCC30063]MCE7526786.1 ABC transporter ATP-binding protein [Polynucleobacter sp. IMCC 30228]MCE7529025.1 ABC transporter ATP-binding protein [Polynucleobacter sp. IMCC 29146]